MFINKSSKPQRCNITKNLNNNFLNGDRSGISFDKLRIIFVSDFHHHQALYDVCENLHTLQPPKVYDNMKGWWVDKAECSPTNIVSHRGAI